MLGIQFKTQPCYHTESDLALFRNSKLLYLSDTNEVIQQRGEQMPQNSKEIDYTVNIEAMEKFYSKNLLNIKTCEQVQESLLSAPITRTKSNRLVVLEKP